MVKARMLMGTALLMVSLAGCASGGAAVSPSTSTPPPQLSGAALSTQATADAAIMKSMADDIKQQMTDVGDLLEVDDLAGASAAAEKIGTSLGLSACSMRQSNGVEGGLPDDYPQLNCGADKKPRVCADRWSRGIMTGNDALSTLGKKACKDAIAAYLANAKTLTEYAASA